MKKLISAILCVTLCIGMFAGCSGKTDQDAETESREEKGEEDQTGESDAEAALDSKEQQIELDKDKLVVGLLKGAEPFSFEEDGEWKGYDVDIWKEFEKRTGIPVEWFQYDTTADGMAVDMTLVTNLAVGKIDVLAIEGLSSLADGSQVLATEPVSYSGLTLAVNSDNESAQNITDISGGINIAVEDSFYNIFESIKAVNNSLETLGSYTGSAPNYLELYRADLQNALPLAMLDIEGWYVMKKDEGMNIRLLEPFGYVEGCYRVTDEKVQSAVNTFIQSIKEDGTLKGISENWFGADVSAERQ